MGLSISQRKSRSSKPCKGSSLQIKCKEIMNKPEDTPVAKNSVSVGHLEDRTLKDKSVDSPGKAQEIREPKSSKANSCTSPRAKSQGNERVMIQSDCGEVAEIQSNSRGKQARDFDSSKMGTRRVKIGSDYRGQKAHESKASRTGSSKAKSQGVSSKVAEQEAKSRTPLLNKSTYASSTVKPRERKATTQSASGQKQLNGNLLVGPPKAKKPKEKSKPNNNTTQTDYAGSYNKTEEEKCLLCEKELIHHHEKIRILHSWDYEEISYDEFYANPAEVSFLPCGHVFHSECLSQIGISVEMSLDPFCMICESLSYT